MRLPCLLLLLLSAFSCQPPEIEKNETIDYEKVYRWKMVTTWPPDFPVFGESCTMLADLVDEMSGGRLKIKVYGSGELVPGLESFGAVSSGVVEMGSGASYYWTGKSPSAQFFAAVPFGMNAQQLNAWMTAGGGYELWKEAYARFDLVPFMAGNSGVQMGGWFNKEIETVDDLKGLKMRIPGIAGKALEKAGGTAVVVAGGEIYTNLERGVIDATEWVGPYHDYKMGFHRIADYYYTPGWHEPGTQLEFFANKTQFESLPPDLRQILETATYQVHNWVLAEFDVKNAEYLRIMKEDGVQIRTFPTEVMEQLRVYSKESMEEMVEGDVLASRVYASYLAFQREVAPWSEVTEEAYFERISE